MTAWGSISLFAFKRYKNKFILLSAKWDNEKPWIRRINNVIVVASFVSILYLCYAIFAKLYF
jgi:hypothetical protein